MIAIKPLLLTPLLASLSLALASCKKGDDSADGSGGGKNQRGQKLDPHVKLATEALKLSSGLADIFAAVKDPETAKTVAGELDELYAQFESINKRMETLGAPTGELKMKIQKMFESEQKMIGERMGGAMAIFLGDKAVGQIVLPALESFGTRMENLKAIELWEGTAGRVE